MATKKKNKPSVKAGVKKRSLNAGPGGQSGKTHGGDPFNNQDVKRRLGHFTTAGEHAIQGGRNTGIYDDK